MNTSSGRMHDGLDDKVEILDTQRGYQTGAAATTTSQPIQELWILWLHIELELMNTERPTLDPSTGRRSGRGRRCLCGDVPGVAPLCPTLALVAAVVLQRLPDPLLDVVMVTPQPWCGRASATATTSLRCPVCARYRRSSMLKKIEDTCRATGLTPGQLVELVELLYV
ncbi:uncharacterized protein [Triticum aestivum]|nr:uncharacterized protein LOC123112356 isoform X2 [Triticum aestivum]XP_044389254.1 uncharacterized protein LOC123112356 isoform X2 [Triticum aestivum]